MFHVNWHFVATDLIL